MSSKDDHNFKKFTVFQYLFHPKIKLFYLNGHQLKASNRSSLAVSHADVQN